MFFDLLNKQHGRSASLLMDLLSLSVKLFSSVSNPDQVLSCLIDLIIEVVFKGVAFITDLFVSFSNGMELVNVVSQFSFLGPVNFIGSFLSFDIEILQSFENIESGINGITSFSLERQHVGQLGLEFALFSHDSGS